MIGCILAGGNGTRLRPMTSVTNKHLLSVYSKPMIYYPLDTLIRGGIKDIMIITGKEHAGDFIELLGSGSEFNVNLTYRVQDGAGGIAEALALCKNFAGDECVAVILGDNIFEDDIKEHVIDYENNHNGAKVFLKEVKDASRFGVPTIKDGRIVDIIEKPKRPVCKYAVTGLYFYNAAVWHVARCLKPSARGELEITDVNNWYIDNSELKYEVLKGFWSDAGTVESLYRASEHVRKNEKKYLKNN